MLGTKSITVRSILLLCCRKLDVEAEEHDSKVDPSDISRKWMLCQKSIITVGSIILPYPEEFEFQEHHH